MDAPGDFTIHSGKLTILAAFGHGGELDKTQIKMLIGSEVIAERWNKPIEIKKFTLLQNTAFTISAAMM